MIVLAVIVLIVYVCLAFTQSIHRDDFRTPFLTCVLYGMLWPWRALKATFRKHTYVHFVDCFRDALKSKE